MNEIQFTRGVNRKPAASEILEKSLRQIGDLSGECFFGYPLVATPEGKFSIDATLVSDQKGIILFDIVEGTDVGEYNSRQDDIANKIESKLRLHRELVQGRRLVPPLQVITFAPALGDTSGAAVDGYFIANEANLASALESANWIGATPDLFRATLSAIESLSSIRKGRSKRSVEKADSRGARLKELEDSIATLDHRQNRAVIETVEGVQRIRGLAGSGKTIVLALKAAYLHAQYPDWRIAVTFNTRSLKGQFKHLINGFCIEQGGEEPDWSKIRIVNAWGAPGGADRDGIYYEFCRSTGSQFFDFKAASSSFGGTDSAFDGACRAALGSASEAPELYDAILVDEAQDFSPSFLRMCYSILRRPKRLVYAYDELQSLSGESLPPPEEIFGYDAAQRPLVSFGDDRRRDVILQKCYRNSRPVLAAAHSLGFGVYRPPQVSEIGLVQMFDQPALWQEIGYRVCEGTLAKGERVVLERTEETSPRFLEVHSPLEDLVHFQRFDNMAQQNDWLIAEILRNLRDDELRHDDIIVINPDPISARRRFGAIRSALFGLGVQTHIAGVDTDADVFFRTDTQSITFTHIYRAKGNEAGMVYVINAQDCDGSGVGLATLRNRLFTAITRSKAWVRVLGWGDGMQNIINEYQDLYRHEMRLEFVYPTDEQLSKLRVVHRDLSPAEKARLQKRIAGFDQAIDGLVAGDLDIEDVAASLGRLDPAKRAQLLKILGGGGQQ
jgi:superfamily I DNA and RNA helicase